MAGYIENGKAAILAGDDNGNMCLGCGWRGLKPHYPDGISPLIIVEQQAG